MTKIMTNKNVKKTDVKKNDFSALPAPAEITKKNFLPVNASAFNNYKKFIPALTPEIVLALARVLLPAVHPCTSCISTQKTRLSRILKNNIDLKIDVEKNPCAVCIADRSAYVLHCTLARLRLIFKNNPSLMTVKLDNLPDELKKIKTLPAVSRLSPELTSFFIRNKRTV